MEISDVSGDSCCGGVGPFGVGKVKLFLPGSLNPLKEAVERTHLEVERPGGKGSLIG